MQLMTDPNDDLPAEVIAALGAANCDWRIGNQLMDRHGRVCTVTDITLGTSGKLVFKLDNGHTYYWRDMQRDYGYLKMRQDLDSLRAEALKALMDPGYLRDLDTPAGDPTSRALAPTNSRPQAAMQARDAAIELREKAALLERMVKEMLEPILSMQHTLMKRIDHLGNILDVLNAFSGIYQEIETVIDGEPAPPETAVTFRQLVLYMDEEAGITDWLRGGVRGIDWQNVDAFDGWLRKNPAHVARVAPEQKCVVALRPSRQRRDRGDWWANFQDDQNNQMLYLLIRNGERVYRIWANCSVGSLFFPTIEDWELLIKRVEEERGDPENENYKAQGIQLGWKRNIAILQGLFERTDCLTPMAHAVNLFDPMSYGNLVNLVRDGEGGFLPSGRPSYRDWKTEINAQIKRGDRVYIANTYVQDRNDLWRYGGAYYKNLPAPPRAGVYHVEDIQSRRHYGELIKVLYLPSDEIWVRDHYGWDTKAREKRTMFRMNRTDDFLLRYDSLDVDTLRYYIDNRLERPQYLKTLPVLCGLLDELEKEQADETMFANLVAGEMNVNVTAVYEAINWWKMKVIYKRPIRSDDAKAWRMIRQRIARAKEGERYDEN